MLLNCMRLRTASTVLDRLSAGNGLKPFPTYEVQVTIKSFHKFVPNPVNGNNVLGVAGVAFQLLAQIPNMGIHGAGGHLAAPDVSQNGMPADRLALVGQKKLEDL